MTFNDNADRTGLRRHANGTVCLDPERCIEFRPTFGSWKDHGEPQEFYYWGNEKKCDEQDGRFVYRVKFVGHLVLTTAYGDINVALHDSYWSSPSEQGEVR